MSTSLSHIEKAIFAADNASFEALALQVFSFQYENNGLYRQYCDMLKVKPDRIATVADLPFLPIQFFKKRQVMSGTFTANAVFESSGTTGADTSKHLVKDVRLYQQSFLGAFQSFYGDIEQYSIMALLPSYLERGNSSLVYMVHELVKRSLQTTSGFYLQEDERLVQNILENEHNGRKTLLLGVTYALLDFSEKYQLDLDHTIVMETGGMKGRRKEMTRSEVHHFLKQRLGINEVHAEYGMTELLSQAYAKKNGIFHCPAWMKVLVRAEDDPFDVRSNLMIPEHFGTGALNIIDLANLYSCAFIATDDMGKLYADGSFEVMGRLDNSDIRGCGLMIL